MKIKLLLSKILLTITLILGSQFTNAQVEAASQWIYSSPAPYDAQAYVDDTSIVVKQVGQQTCYFGIISTVGNDIINRTYALEIIENNNTGTISARTKLQSQSWGETTTYKPYAGSIEYGFYHWLKNNGY